MLFVKKEKMMMTSLDQLSDEQLIYLLGTPNYDDYFMMLTLELYFKGHKKVMN